MSDVSLNSGNNKSGRVDEGLVTKNRNFIFTIEIAREQLQRQVEFFPRPKPGLEEKARYRNHQGRGKRWNFTHG